jgi:hypothetical protein
MKISKQIDDALAERSKAFKIIAIIASLLLGYS